MQTSGKSVKSVPADQAGSGGELCPFSIEQAGTPIAPLSARLPKREPGVGGYEHPGPRSGGRKKSGKEAGQEARSGGRPWLLWQRLRQDWTALAGDLEVTWAVTTLT